MYTSEQAAVTAIRELGAGWEVFPYDAPDRGVLGYCAVRGSKEHIFQWALFGKELAPKIQIVGGEDVLAFIQGEPADLLGSCDDPKMRQLGFVSYRKAKDGLAMIRRVSLTKVKMMNQHPRALLMQVHERHVAGHKKRFAAAKAIRPYGWLRVMMMQLVRRILALFSSPSRT